MLMNNLPRLRKEPLQDKLRAYDKVGGHPKTIELLEGYLADHSLREVLENEEIQDQLTAEWERYFMGALLERLSADEEEKLTALCVFRGAFGMDIVTHVGGDNALIERLRDLELIQREEAAPDGSARYSIHPVVREYLMGRLTEAQREAHHLRAAEYYQEQILEPYRDQLTEEGKKQPQKAGLAMLDQLANQTQDMDLTRWAVDTGLAWREHLFAAQCYEEAWRIIPRILRALMMWGRLDLAKAILRESIAMLTGGSKAEAQGNLATLLMNKGKLDKALAMYQEVYLTFEELGAKPQMVSVLQAQGYAYQGLGEYDKAIEKHDTALALAREIDYSTGQSLSLHHLSMLYEIKKDYDRALETSQEAEELARKLGNDDILAATLHNRGLILNALGRPEEAFAPFQESLAISRRIGAEAGTADSLGEIGKLLRDARRIREAIAAFTECIDIHRRLNNPAKLGIDLEMLGRIHELQEEYEAALEKYEKALASARKYTSPQEVAIIEQDIARVRGKLGGRSASGGMGLPADR